MRKPSPRLLTCSTGCHGEQWGDGSTSSSDGQAFPIAMRRPVIAQTNAKYGRDPVVTFYTHISDRYAPFHTKAISSTVRDAPHVLDGLLGHDTGSADSGTLH